MTVNKCEIMPWDELMKPGTRGREARDAVRYAADQKITLPSGVPIVPNIDKAILDVVTIGEGRLDMGEWHTCRTTHCRAGWAVILAGKAGSALEDALGPEYAGALIYAASRPNKPIPNFFVTDEQAMRSIRKDAGCVD